MIAKFQSRASQIRDSTPQGSLPWMEFAVRFAAPLLTYFAPRGCIARAWTVGELLRARTATAAAAIGHSKTLTYGAAERVDRLGRAGT
jgi:glycogen debranching enzyme